MNYGIFAGLKNKCKEVACRIIAANFKKEYYEKNQNEYFPGCFGHGHSSGDSAEIEARYT
jgi:hypothetical protein